MAGKQQTIKLRNSLAEVYGMFDSMAIIDERCFTEKERCDLKAEIVRIIKKIDAKMMQP